MDHAILDRTVIIKCDKTESSGSSGLFVHHQRRIENSSKLFEIFFEFFFDDILTDPANEYFGRAILLLTRDCAFRVDLRN
jgi:hypothetical protein